jgi:hypothetical protein
MTYKGAIQNGVVVFQEGLSPPEGTLVTVVPNARTTGQAPAALGREVEAEQRNAPSNAEPETAIDEPTIGQKLAALGRWAESQPCDLPEDLAENHDHYIHGAPKHS